MPSRTEINFRRLLRSCEETLGEGSFETPQRLDAFVSRLQVRMPACACASRKRTAGVPHVPGLRLSRLYRRRTCPR